MMIAAQGSDLFSIFIYTFDKNLLPFILCLELTTTMLPSVKIAWTAAAGQELFLPSREQEDRQMLMLTASDGTKVLVLTTRNNLIGFALH
jgi:hypothetical protein